MPHRFRYSIKLIYSFTVLINEILVVAQFEKLLLKLSFTYPSPKGKSARRPPFRVRGVGGVPLNIKTFQTVPLLSLQLFSDVNILNYI